MTMNDYLLTIDEEERDEMAETLFHCYEEDYDDFCMWAIENGIDLDATVMEGGIEFNALTLWAFDMRA